MKDSVDIPSTEFDIYYGTKTNKYCQANFMYTMLNEQNNFLKSDKLYIDISSKNKLWKKLDTDYELMN